MIQKNDKFGDQFIQFIFKDDLVKIILKIINSKPKKKINIILLIKKLK